MTRCYPRPPGALLHFARRLAAAVLSTRTGTEGRTGLPVGSTLFDIVNHGALAGRRQAMPQSQCCDAA